MEKKKEKAFGTIIRDDNIIRLLKENIFYENTVIEDLETLSKISKLDKNTELYDKLYNKVVSVGEYKLF
jgi:hypothetical protein